MKKFWAAVILISICAGGFFVFQSRNSVPQNPAAAATSSATTTAADKNSAIPAASKNPGSVAAIPPASASQTSAAGQTAPAVSLNSSVPALGLSSLPPLTVLDNARVIMKNYGSAFGENPVGTNPEITEALLGKNPKGITFITPESGLRVNDLGEMVDAWGTPFFFHQLSGQEMEIHSAGEDRKMWTSDDLITR